VQEQDPKKQDKITDPGAVHLLHLPPEVLVIIIQHVRYEDAEWLRRTCRRMKHAVEYVWLKIKKKKRVYSGVDSLDSKQRIHAVFTSLVDIRKLDNVLLMDRMAYWGDLEGMQYAHNTLDWPLDHVTTRKAAEGGHVHILEWMLEKGTIFDGLTLKCALQKGHCHVVMWAFEKYRGSRMSADTSSTSDDTHTLLRTNFPMICQHHGRLLCAEAVRSGSLEILESLRTIGCEWDSWSFTAAVETGNLQMMEWLHTNGCPMDHWTCASAAECGRLDILKWLRERGCRWNPMTCSYAARCGFGEILKWAHSNGCDWTGWTTCLISQTGDLDLLHWAIANGCPFDPHRCVAHARVTGQTHIMEWIESQQAQV
jgi:hypothetical protein